MATREYQFIVGPETSTLPAIGSPSASTDLITLGYADSNYTQGKQSVADITALKAVTNTGDGARADGDVIEVQSTNSVYIFDAGSAASGNDDTIVTPAAGTGRWLKVAQPIAVSTDNVLPKFDGVGGALQASGITVDDSNNVTGVSDLTVTGDLTVNGTTTTLNTQTLNVEDLNVTVNFGGNDASSEGSGITVDRTGTKGSLIYAAAAASKFKIGNLASEVEVADISSGQTFTNKTIAYASNTITGVQPTSTLTTKGDLYVATASATVTRQGIGGDGQVLVADSTQANGMKWATANSGSKNYFQFNSFENNATTGWSLGTVTAPASPTFFPTAAPTFGSGASGNLSISAVSGSPVAGTYALSYASSAATTAGNFLASDAFTIDAEDQAKMLAFKFSYKAAVNPTNANWSGTTANSFGVAIYDVTNSAWIQPAGCFNLVQSSGVGQASGTFQTSSNGTSYRLVVYNANATSGAVTVYFDSFFVGPQITAAGAAVSDWTSYTPTGGWTGAVSYNGKWRRVGDSIEVIAQISCSGAPTGANPTINLPSGFTIDTTKIATGTQREPLGLAVFVDFGVETYRGVAFYNNTTSVMPVVHNASATYATDTIPTATIPFTFGASDLITVEFKVPIVGWSSNTVMSSDTDTRVVAAQAYRASSSQSISGASDVKIQWNAAYKNSHGTMDTSTNYRFTVPVSGTYKFSGIVVLGASTGASAHALILYKNGTPHRNLGNILSLTTSTFAMQISAQDDAVTGDYYEVYLNTGNQTTSVLSTVSIHGGSQFNIERLSGPATIAASSVVAAKATGNPTNILSASNTTVNCGSLAHDTHGAYNITSGVFTVPVSGYYQGTCVVEIAGTETLDQYVVVGLFKNGVSAASNGVRSPGTVNTTNCMATGTVYCNAGDTLDFRCGTTIASPVYSASLTGTRVEFSRLGGVM